MIHRLRTWAQSEEEVAQWRSKVIVQIVAEVGLESGFLDAFSLLCYPRNTQPWFSEWLFQEGGKKAQLPAPGGPSWVWEEGPGEILSSCASLNCQTIASRQNHWPRKCKNISGTGVLNSWWEKKFWLLDFLVCYLLVFLGDPLSTSGLSSSRRNNFLVALEENNLMFAQQPGEVGERRACRRWRGWSIPLGLLHSAVLPVSSWRANTPVVWGCAHEKAHWPRDLRQAGSGLYGL